jgi:hypothetical protein
MKRDEKEAATFAEMLAEMSHGEVDKLATKKLREIIQACKETGKKGSVTITLAIGSDPRLCEIAASVKTTKPEPKVPGQTYYTDEDGNLHNEDPRQMKLPAKIIDVSQNPPRIVGGKVD